MSSFDKRYVEFSKPFVQAIEEIYKSMLSCEVKAGSPSLKNKNESNGFYSALIGMNGSLEKNGEEKKFQGNIAVTWPKEVYLKGASAMLMEEYTDYSDEIEDVGMEIINMIMGNAKKQLNPEGYKIDMATPSSVVGEDHLLGVKEGTSTVVIPFESGHGNFFIEINYFEEE